MSYETADFTNHLEDYEEILAANEFNICGPAYRKRRVDNMKWHAATLRELTQIIRDEECPMAYKCLAEIEMERRLSQYEMVYEL